MRRGRGAGDEGKSRNKPEHCSGCFHLLSSHFTAKPRLAASPVSSPPSPESHGSCTKQELGSCRSSGFARRCKNVLHLQTTPVDADSPESRTPSTNLPSPPQTPDPSRSGSAAPAPPAGGARLLAAKGRAHRLSRRQPGSAPAVPAPRTATAAAAPPGGPGGSGASAPPREARGGGAEGRGARPLGYLLGQGHCALAAAPRLLPVLLARPARWVSAGSGRRDAAIAHHTHAHTRTAGGGAAAAAEAAALPCSAGAAAAQLPPRNGAAVTWGTGTSKVLPLPPLRHTQQQPSSFLLLLFPGALDSLTENSGQETAADLAAAPVNEIRHHWRAGQEEKMWANGIGKERRSCWGNCRLLHLSLPTATGNLPLPVLRWTLHVFSSVKTKGSLCSVGTADFPERRNRESRE